MSDFSRKTLSNLASKGITLVGLQQIPAADGSFANGETGYCLNDNGTHRVLRFREVLALAA